MKKLLATIMALTLALIMSVSMVGCNVIDEYVDDIDSKTQTETTVGTSSGSKNTATSSTAKKNDVQRVAVTFSAGATVPASETEPAHVTKRLEAVVEPATAPQEVDYTVAWSEGASRSAEDVSEYLKVEQDADGSVGATVKCYKGFGSDTIVITCTTRSRQKQDVCLVTFEGLTKSITITHSFEQTEDTRGTFYYVPVGNTYETDITISSVFGDEYTSNVEIALNYVVKGTGTVYVLKKIETKNFKNIAYVYPLSVQELFSSTGYCKIKSVEVSRIEYPTNASIERIVALKKTNVGNTFNPKYEYSIKFTLPDILSGNYIFNARESGSSFAGIYLFAKTTYGSGDLFDYVYMCDADGNQTDATQYTATQIIEMNNQALSDTCFEVSVVDSVSGSSSEIIRFWPYWPANVVHGVSGLPDNIVI